jgi:16S rRNA (cytosine967-C5)-methyltransferase
LEGRTFDLVLCDVPCSGSGAWRRDPDGKWALTPDRLKEFPIVTGSILDEAKDFVATGGTLAVATCSVLSLENEGMIDAFKSRHPGWRASAQTRWPMDDLGDGFFAIHLTREN